MSWILDVIILLIFGITVFISYKKGFIKTLVSAGAFLAAIIITALFAQPFADFLKTTPIAHSVETAAEEKIIAILDEKMLELDDLIDGESEEFNRLVQISGISTESLDEWKGRQETEREEAIKSIAGRISSPVIDTFARVLSVMILYIGVQVTLTVVGFILDKIAKLPILRTFNKALGIALGAVLGLFRVFLFCFMADLLIKVGNFMGNGLFADFDIAQTSIFRLIIETNLFSFFI